MSAERDPIQDAIDVLEKEAQCAREAINRGEQRIRDLEAKIKKEAKKIERTRTQHLDRANRLIADLMIVKARLDQ